MGDLGDYLARKSTELGLERGNQLAEIQKYLDSLYPGQCRAASIHNGVLKITTPSASVASELRMRRTAIVSCLNQKETLISGIMIHIA